MYKIDDALNIRLRPEQEFAILEAIRAGLISSEEEILYIGQESFRARISNRINEVNNALLEIKNNLADIISSVKCGDLDFVATK